MKLATYQKEAKEEIGFVLGDRIYPLKQFGIHFETMNQLIEYMSYKQLSQLVFSQEAKMSWELKEVQLQAPIPCPRQDIICLGMNYATHAEESARYKKEDFFYNKNHAVYFSKRVNRATAPFEVIDHHFTLDQDLDYECELAIIIGQDCRHVKKEQVWDVIFGYTILNDITARSVQTHHKQWYFGKSFDMFAPMGPWIVTADEFGKEPTFHLECRVNGEIRQQMSTDLLIFDIAHIISELSQGMTLLAGTIIATGTPSGVGMGFNPPRFLQSQDCIECTISEIGTLVNKIK